MIRGKPRVEKKLRTFWIPALILAVVPALPAPASSRADEPDIKDWIGKRVVQRHNNFPLRKDGEAVLRSGTEVHIYRVARVEGERLWLEGEGDGPSGWASADQFIRVEEACAYFADRIRARPDEVFFYVVRAALARDRKDIDGAIADWNKIVELEPNDANSYIGRGNLWLGKKVWNKAIADFDHAVQIEPDNAELYYIRAWAWQQKGDHLQAAADYAAGIALDPNFGLPPTEPAARPDEIADAQKAVDDFLRAVPLEHASTNVAARSAASRSRDDSAVPASFDPVPAPQNTDQPPTAGRAHHTPAPKAGPQPALSRDTFGVLEPQTAQDFITRAADWLQIRQSDKAIADCNQAINLGSHDPRARIFRGLAWFDKKDYDNAIADQTEAIRLDPQNAFAYYARGTAWGMKKQYEKSVVDLAESARIDPENPAAANGVAWIRATCPDAKYRDGHQAVASATRACELTEWAEPGIIDTLAAAYAEIGDFGRAVKWQTRAVELEKDSKNADEFRDRLKLFREKKPFRDTKP